MGNVPTVAALAGYYAAFGVLGLAAAALLHRTLKRINKTRANDNIANRDNPNYKKKEDVSRLWYVLPLLVTGIPSVIVGLTKHTEFNRRNDLVKLISDNTDHFFARVKDTLVDIKVPEDIARKAVDKIDAGKLSDTIDQVKNDRTTQAEFIKLFDELRAAYAAGTVFRKGDDTTGGALGYY